MKGLIAAAALAAIAAIAWLVWPRDAAPPASHSSTRDAAATATGTQPSAPVDTSRVRKLAPDERRRLGDQIRAALAKARTASTAAAGTATSTTTPAGNAPALADEPQLALEDVTKELSAALADSLPLVAECYEKHGKSTQAMAKMTMISDPDLGTVIDTEAIIDRDGKAVEAKLDECMRDTIDSLGLPPLGKPGKLKVQYTFQITE